MDIDQTMDMEKLVEELQLSIPFKDDTVEGDVVMMLREGEDSLVTVTYARVMGFERDTTKRDEWWHVQFLFLEAVPSLRPIILQTPHFTGGEVFTMGGRKVFIKALNFEAYAQELEAPPAAPAKPAPPAGPKGDRKKPTFTLVK